MPHAAETDLDVPVSLAEPATLHLPPPPEPAAPTPVPVIAALAPVAGGILICLVTGSTLSLVIAALGPVLAIGAWLDGRRHRRRADARARQRYETVLARAADRLRLEHDRERRALVAAHPAGGCWPPVLGVGDVASRLRVTGDLEHPLAAEARTLVGAPVVVDADAYVFEGRAAAAAARSVLEHALAVGGVVVASAPWRTDPDGVGVAVVEVRGRRVRLAVGAGSVGAGWGGAGAVGAGSVAGVVVRADGVGSGSVRAEGVGAGCSIVPRLAALAAVAPTAVPRHSVGATAVGIGFAVPLGIDERGDTVVVDLVVDGPHAAIAGTTGSGKSELLLTWVRGLAAATPPEHLGVLLVDFKGGSTFASLAELPHCVGVVSDLDAAGARRAIASLAAEVRRRERLLVEAGARDAAEAGIARLLVVVDEFAALAAAQPLLEPLFADLAARGRALGIHLVLASQRPVGALGDRMLANCTVRIALRLPVPGDRERLVGASTPAPGPEAGAAVIRIGDGEPHAMRVLVSEPAHPPIAGSPPRRPWHDPLPDAIPDDAVARVLGAVVGSVEGDVLLGVADDPEHQRRTPAHWRPSLGPLVVYGGAASGRSTAAARIAGRLGVPVVGDPASLWDAVLGGGAGPLVVDDLDVLVDEIPLDQRLAMVEALQRRMRTGGPVVATAQRAADLGRLAGLAADVVVLGGGAAPGEPANGRSVPGRGLHRGLEVQLITAGDRGVAAARAVPRSIALPDGPLWIVAADADRWPDAVPLDAVGAEVPTGVRVIGGVEAWHRRLRAAAGPHPPLVFDGTAAADVRLLVGAGALVPLVGGPQYALLARAGSDRLERCRVPTAD